MLHVIAGTGHRPPRLGLSYSRSDFNKLTDFALRYLRSRDDCAFTTLSVVSGMALGWDQALALAAIRLELSLTAAIPFDGQHLRWPKEAQNLYKLILRQASHVHCVGSSDRAVASFHARDRWMIGNSDETLALYDGKSYGGTHKTIQYAEKQNKPITNIWSAWQLYRGD